MNGRTSPQHGVARTLASTTLWQAAASDEPVLVVAAAGPGRRLVARLLHRLGRRAHGPFLLAACGLLSPDALDQASGGTLCVDGIEGLPEPDQERLLGALPTSPSLPSLDPRDVRELHDVRLVAMIGETPASAVQAGRLSPALLTRCLVVDLRDGCGADGADGVDGTDGADGAACVASAATSVVLPIGSSLADMEKRFILATLDRCGGDKRRCASMLGISLRTLYNRLHDWKIVEAWTSSRLPPPDRAA